MYFVSCKAWSTQPTGVAGAGGGPKAPLAPSPYMCLCVRVRVYLKVNLKFCLTSPATIIALEVGEMELELPMENNTRLRKTKIRRVKSDKIELYNFVLIGLTNELIELDISADIKITRKVESNVTDSAIPTCLSEEISLKELNRSKKFMITVDYDRFIQSQMSSERDTLSKFNQSVYSIQSSRHTQHTRQSFENIRIKEMTKKMPIHKHKKCKQNHVKTQYKTEPELTTPMKLWVILYAREGHLSYYKLDRLIPPEVILTKNDVNFLSRAAGIKRKGMRRIIGRMAKFLGVTTIICSDFLPLINRHCSELNLPKKKKKNIFKGISLYTKRLVALPPPKMKYIECRKAVLANAHYHIKLKYNLHISDVNSLDIKFFETVDFKVDREEPEIITHKHLYCVNCYIHLLINEMNEFSSSLMAHHSYLQQLLEHPLYDLPSILRNGFFSTKIGYMIKPEFISKLTSNYNMQINFIDSNLHFVEKTIQLFKQIKMDNDDNDTRLKHIVPEETTLLLSKFSVFKNSNKMKKQKRKFLEIHVINLQQNCNYSNLKQNIENPNKDDSYTEESEIVSRENFEIKNILPNIILRLSINASIFDDLTKNEIEYDADDQLLRLFKDYWMYHCNFSGMKTKNFELFEKMPRTEDLYEEVCLVEAYYAYFSEQFNCAPNTSDENTNNKAYINAILKKMLK
ncbi:hypothetical protein ACFW04_008636 [Cataglyphis niger]